MSSWVVANIQIQNVVLHQLMGAYELHFGLMMNVKGAQESPHEVWVHGARAYVKGSSAVNRLLGHAWPVQPVRIEQSQHEHRSTPALAMELQGAMLEALEAERDGGDLDFELQIFGVATRGEHADDTVRFHMPRSQWIKNLNDVGARRSLLLEVPLGAPSEGGEEETIGAYLKEAEAHFANGHWKDCIGACRLTVEQIWAQNYGETYKRGELLSRLAQERRDMSKDEREALMWASLHHYTHPAHHSTSQAGADSYSRDEAKMALVLAAEFARRMAV